MMAQEPVDLLDLAAVVLLIAAFMLTSPEGYAPADGADRRLRRALRVAAMVPLVALALFHAYAELSVAAFTVPSWTAGFGMSAIGFAAAALATVGTAPLPLLLFRQLRGLARRARSAHLAEHCTIVGVGAALSFVYCGVFSFIAAYGTSLGLSPYWMNRSAVWLAMMLLLSVVSFLFLLWSLYLLIRFAVAFNRAARQLRGKWSQADRATVPGLA